MSENDPGAVAAPEPTLLHGCPVSDSRGQAVVHVPRDRYVAVVKALMDEGYHVVADVTAVDYLSADRRLPDGVVGERFELVVNLLDMGNRRRLRLRVQVPESDPTVPSLFALFPGVEMPEREVFDMFGISFTDHPDLTRVLMPEDWIGFPLRKDYDVGRIPVQFKGAPEHR